MVARACCEALGGRSHSSSLLLLGFLCKSQAQCRASLTGLLVIIQAAGMNEIEQLLLGSGCVFESGDLTLELRLLP
eukprot:4845865-Pyramimonas_sp.AAC.1